MVRNKIDGKGFYTDGLFDGSAINEISGTTTFSSNVTFTTTSISRITNFAALPRYAAYQNTGSQDFTGDSIHSVVRFNGKQNIVDGGLNLWNTSSHIFTPTEIGRLYTARVDGILSASTGTPVFHIDFELSGAIATDGTPSHHTNASIHRQSYDVDVVKGAGTDHSHFHIVFLMFSDSAMVASGVQFYGAIDGNQTVSFKSGVLFIKEG